MDDATFDKIQKSIVDAIPEILDQFIANNNAPSDKLVDAIAYLYDCSPNEFRAFAEKYAHSKGATIFPGH